MHVYVYVYVSVYVCACVCADVIPCHIASQVQSLVLPESCHIHAQGDRISTQTGDIVMLVSQCVVFLPLYIAFPPPIALRLDSSTTACTMCMPSPLALPLSTVPPPFVHPVSLSLSFVCHALLARLSSVAHVCVFLCCCVCSLVCIVYVLRSADCCSWNTNMF